MRSQIDKLNKLCLEWILIKAGHESRSVLTPVGFSENKEVALYTPLSFISSYRNELGRKFAK
jgi:hypothetical protein